MKWLIFLKSKNIFLKKGMPWFYLKPTMILTLIKINKHSNKTKKVQEELETAIEELSSLIRKFYTMKNMRNTHLHETLSEVFLEEYRNNSMCIKTHSHSRF